MVTTTSLRPSLLRRRGNAEGHRYREGDAEVGLRDGVERLEWPREGIGTTGSIGTEDRLSRHRSRRTATGNNQTSVPGVVHESCDQVVWVCKPRTCALWFGEEDVLASGIEGTVARSDREGISGIAPS